MAKRAFLKTRYRVLPGVAGEGDHWLGGPAFHRGSVCPACKSPLRLLWNLNAKDSRFPRGKFGSMDRVPLYFCWHCLSDFGYQMTDHKRLKTFRIERLEGQDFPYKPYPEHFERRPLSFDSSVPAEVRKTLKEWDDEKLASKPTRRIVEPFLGHAIVSWRDVFFNQFGGAPLNCFWFDERPRCPNPRCPGRLSDGRGYSMSFLAGVLNEPERGLPMATPTGGSDSKFEFLVTVQFHICSKCLTLHACNRCD
jgi:hypothetical protein